MTVGSVAGRAEQGSAGAGLPGEGSVAEVEIREAALRLFAERGIAPVTIEDIAAAAGMSVEVVRQHFSTKEVIREACDSYVVDWTNQLRDRILSQGQLVDQMSVDQVFSKLTLISDYFLNSLMDGSAAAAALFDRVVEVGQRYLDKMGIEVEDPRACSAVLCAMKIGVLILRSQLSRALGEDVRAPSGYTRLTQVMVDIFAKPLLPEGQLNKINSAMAQLRR